MIRDSRGGHNRKQVNEDFFKKWSAGMAYVLGFMFADGSLIDSNESSRTYYLSFANNDLKLLEDIRDLMESKHKIYSRPPKIMEHKRRKYVSRTGYVLRLGNKEMYKDLVSLGMTHRKSNTMHLPKIPTQCFSFFLRGYSDGDGCIHLSHCLKGRTPRLKLVFTSGSNTFLSELATLVGKILVIRPPNFYQSTNAYNLTASGATAFRIIDYMYQRLDSAPYLKRKYRKYLEYKNDLMGPRIKKRLSLIM